MGTLDKEIKIIMLKGEKGNSSYEEAVENGLFSGTLEEWIATYATPENYVTTIDFQRVTQEQSGDISDLQEDVSDLQNDVLGLQNDVSSLNDDVYNETTGLKNRVSNNESNINDLQNDVLGLQNDVSNLNDEVYDETTGLKNRVSINETDINYLQENVSKLEQDISNIGTLEPKGTGLSTDILNFGADDGIWIGTDTGHWYYWNGTQYVDGGNYLSTTNVVSHNRNQLKDENNTNLYPNTYDVNFIRFDKYGLQATNIMTLNTGLPYQGNSNLARASYTKSLTINGIPINRTLRIYKVDTLTESLSGKGTIINNGDTITIEENKYYKFTLDGDENNQAINCNTIYYNEIVANGTTLNRLNEYEMVGNIAFNKFGLQATNIMTLNTGLPYFGHSDLFRTRFNSIFTAYNIPSGRTLRIYAVDTLTSSLVNAGHILTNGEGVAIPKNKYYRFTLDGDSTTPATSITDIFIDVSQNFEVDTNKWNGKKFGFIGDSITQGQYSTKSYPSFIGDELNVTITNLANAGDTLLRIYSQIDNLPADLDAIFVMGGTNNYKLTGIQGQIGNLLKTVDGNKVPNDDNSICGVLNKICIKLKQLYPNALIVILNPPKSVRGYNDSDDTTAPFNLMDLRKAYYDVGEINSCMVIDISSECIINSQIDESAEIYYTHIWTSQESETMAGQRDLTHPTYYGHEQIAKTIIEKIS